MNYKNIFILLILTLFFGSCDRDKFAELNSDPSTLSDPDLRYSITKAIEQMYSNDYTNWFYSNFQYIFPWTQVTTIQDGNNADFNVMGPYGSQGIYGGLFPQTMDVRMRIDDMSEEDQATRQALKAITYPIQITPALTNTDLTGSMVYSEAGLAPYTNPPLLTPEFDSQEELFNIWLEELDGAIEVLSNTENQLTLANQDVIYQGDYSKWAKYCNLLKLKIAARLVNKNRSKALAIAEEVVNSPAGYLDGLDDDFIYQRGINYFGTGNGMWIGYGNKRLVDFLLQNQDPRLRFIFKKNDFNGEVVQAFIDAGQDLPPFIEPLVQYDENGNFEGWDGPGEPWVRYHGAPVSPDATQDPANDIYFNQSAYNRIAANGVEKTYSSTILYQEKLTRTTYNYTYPTKPGGRVIELRDNDPPLNIILGSSAEANLYLAEFKQLGANLPKSAQEYLNWGVELSVKRADLLAENNQLPYYSSDPVYTDADMADKAATYLRDGEIESLLQNPAYDLSTDGLEKIYIQQYINFMNTPSDLWATVRRSGVPKKGSDYLAWEEFTSSGNSMPIPRRFTVGTPTPDDINYDNQLKSVQEQGFTTGDPNPTILNAERLWFDLEDPEYGAGPK
ncbi:SusD/RagB family nutrient-binding outer membrane lipoprotein [Membranihabitans maritimus]|uniref:SusD/RagB family nutrient-binding outer membrane lipoprotein n=1 Tax=Membranihabitans maritimus TaxID=2904244 RepID=UPI001F18F344|nr:SusD/RagB family nutrient-binding outer membrane lipoprotein [Membranihabitans maritimus]